MGRRALTSHLEGKKHAALEKATQGSFGIRLFTCPNQPSASTQPSTSAQPSISVPSTSGEDPSVDPDDDLQEMPDSSVQKHQPAAAINRSISSTGTQNLTTYLLREDVTRAEIIWCLQTVTNHMTMSSAAKAVKLFPMMFPDSQTVLGMQLGRVKISYTLVHGLAPFFHSSLVEEVKSASCFVAFFDESLNKFSQKQQMDLAVRYWSEEKDEVSTRYFSSAFLCHAAAVDLIAAFKKELDALNLKRLLQISMDGPNVNLKFFKDFEHDMRLSKDPEDPLVLFMGTCGLHVVNNSFKCGANATGWDVVKFLRSSYNVFKDLPSRRGDYTLYSGSDSFPLKFCSVRWLNNGMAADRAKSILPHLKAYVEHNNKVGKEIHSTSYKMLVAGVNDKLMGAKLTFFSYVAAMVEPFLTEFQTDTPMAPFLHRDLTAVMAQLMSVFVKDEVLKKVRCVSKVDMEKDCVLPKHLKVGFSVKAELRKIELKDLNLLMFKKECSTMLKAMCLKLLQKSPLKYALCKGISFCDSYNIFRQKEECHKRLETALEIFQEKQWLSSVSCDKISQEFKMMCSNSALLEVMKGYKRQECRLDHFWKSVVTNFDVSLLFYDFLKMIFIMSHGNAFVEIGFSINKECVVENQLSRSLVAQRQVYDGVQAAGGLDCLEISKSMINSARHARALYGEALDEQKKKRSATEDKTQAKKALTDEIRELKEKRLKILAEKDKEVLLLDEEIFNLTHNAKK